MGGGGWVWVGCVPRYVTLMPSTFPAADGSTSPRARRTNSAHPLYISILHLMHPSVVEGVFIFQASPDDALVTTSYDAIVVEQWTVIDVSVCVCLCVCVSPSVC